MEPWQTNVMFVTIAVVLVLLNGFFVAAEFALVKVRKGQLDALVARGRPFAKSAKWLLDRLDASLSACQIGITMASLALGWVGEPAFARLLEPLFLAVGITSTTVLHTAGFIVAFTIITALHLVIGEQVPKIYSIRRPEVVVLWCAWPLRFFYMLFYPFQLALSASTAQLLRLVGIEGASEHDTPHTQAEIGILVRQAHGQGELTRSESRLIQAAFRFDDMVCRRVMVPRSDVVFLDVEEPLAESLKIVRESQHTRYPLCEDSLEHVLGIIHIKDLVGLDAESQIDLRKLAREAHHVPEKMPISQLLQHFQKTHHLMAMVVDEHGTVIGVVTLENVLEQIIGPVEDEFDSELPDIEADGDGQFIVRGSAPLDVVNRWFDLDLDAAEVDTMAGIMLEDVGRVLQVGDQVDFDGTVAEVIAVEGARATHIRMTVPGSESEEEEKAVGERTDPTVS